MFARRSSATCSYFGRLVALIAGPLRSVGSLFCSVHHGARHADPPRWPIPLVHLLHHVLIVVVGVRRRPVRKTRFVELRARRCRGIHRGNVVGRKRQGRGDESMSAGRQPGSISDPELVHPDQAKAGGRAESGRRLNRLSDLLADVDADGWNSSSGLEVLRLIRRECVAESSRWINRAGNLGESGVAAVGVHADPARGLTTSSETPQVSTCGDDENRTLNPRLANSIHPVRHGPGMP